MIEKELKYLLSKQDYLKLKQYFDLYGENKKLSIIYTYYYDTIPFTFLPSMAFRIRRWEGFDHYHLNVKANLIGRLPNEQSPELQVAKEFDFIIDDINIERIKDKFPLNVKELNELGINQQTISFIQELKNDLSINQDYLELLGQNEIERFHGILQFYNMPFDLDLVKHYSNDKSKNFEDYELEIEGENTDRYVNIINSIFNQNQIKSLGSQKKIQRLLNFFTQYGNLLKF